MEKLIAIYRKQSRFVRLVLLIPITVLLLVSQAEYKNILKSLPSMALFIIAFYLLRLNYQIFNFAEFEKIMPDINIKIKLSLYVIILVLSTWLLSKNFLNKNAMDEFKLFLEALTINARIPFSFLNRILLSCIIILSCSGLVNFALANPSKIENMLHFIK